LRKYKHIFFDLDRTLWDFDNNTALTLKEILILFNLRGIIRDEEFFIHQYHKHNDYVWDLYKKKCIRKKELRAERFRLLLNDFGIVNSELVRLMDEYYLAKSPQKPLVIPHTHSILEYLSRRYQLYIITNGFQEVQETKLQSSNIYHYFKKVFTSDKLGISKPNKQFFEAAIKSSNARKAESIVIGDDLENDIKGAINFGVDQVWLNPNHLLATIQPTFTIYSLEELKAIL
jgi:putative hydrolase of the HAD superfamily